ncbi:hypothetical protein GCM10022420_023170 [Streptomyces iranensis]
MTSSASATARRTGTISEPQRMSPCGGRRREAGAGGGEEREEASAGDAAGDAPGVPGVLGVPGVPGVPGDELRGGGSGETLIVGHLSADGW